MKYWLHEITMVLDPLQVHRTIYMADDKDFYFEYTWSHYNKRFLKMHQRVCSAKNTNVKLSQLANPTYGEHKWIKPYKDALFNQITKMDEGDLFAWLL